MKIVFCLLCFVYLSVSPAFACTPDPEYQTIAQTKACVSTPGCIKECKKELIATIDWWTIVTFHKMIKCGKKVCGEDLECQQKFVTLPEMCW